MPRGDLPHLRVDYERPDRGLGWPRPAGAPAMPPQKRLRRGALEGVPRPGKANFPELRIPRF